MTADRVKAILELAQAVDLYGRSDKFARHLQAGEYTQAIADLDAALLDCENMTNPDRTIFRRNVHERNGRKIEELREQVQALKTD